MKSNIFVFDCESTSLHGIAFAVGAIVLERTTGKEIDRFQLLAEEGKPLCNDWVKENVLPHLDDLPSCKTLKELRDHSFTFYIKHKDAADIYSDVNFPVETKFLSTIVADNPKEREFLMPFPLYDIVNHIPIDIDRHAACGIPNLRKHHPFDDAYASATCYLNSFRKPV